MDDHFLLTTQLSQQLYHGCAGLLPVIDYHNHLSVRDLAENRRYQNLAQLWLVSDPYKHRAMRICGVPEQCITGDADDFEKFAAWMAVLPRLMGNPLYDWSVMEMKRVFDIDLIPGVTDAVWLWGETNRKLAMPEYSALALLARFHVEYAAPCAALTDDIADYLRFDNLAPSLRGDDLTALIPSSIDRLEHLTKTAIHTLESYYAAIDRRLDGFAHAGCRFSDHALDNGFAYLPDDGKNRHRFQMWRQSGALEKEDQIRLTSDILRFLAGAYARRGWTMQLHIGAQRNTSTRLRTLAGPAGGFAGIGSGCDVSSLTRMLDDFERDPHGLPRVILFTLNPADNAVMSVLSGSYSQDGVIGKVQQGPAWWWCDHLYGMREVFESISAYGVLSTFIGMTTDSRSLLSFVRHEYFRRALCGWIGEKAARGEFPAEGSMLKTLVEDICYRNAKNVVTGG